jgi:hypothetical protein
MSDHSAPFNILGSFADPSSFDTGAAKLINTRVVLRAPTEGRPAKLRLVGTPGLTSVCRPTTSEVIAIGKSQGTAWSVHANGNVYSGVETNAPTLKGAVNFGGVQYPIARLGENKVQLAIAANYDTTGGGGKGSGYVATLGGGVVNQNFQSVSNISFDPSSVNVLDNIAIWAGGSNIYAAGQDFRMFASAPGDAGSVSPLAFASKEGRADALLDIGLTIRNFYAFGQLSIEPWYNSGNGADFPFVPYTNTLFGVGLANRRTLATIHNKLMWVASDNRVWMGQDQSAGAVSPGWLDLELQRLANTSHLLELTAYMYAQGGDEFYVLNRPGFWTLEMAVSSGVWNYVQSHGRSDSARRCALEYLDGVSLVGLDTGHICMLDITNANEPAGRLNRELISPWIGDQTAYHVIDAITATSSLGPSAGNFTLDWSEDNFATVKGARQITFGSPGARRAIARQLGSSRRRQVRMQYSGATAPFEFDELFGDVSAGT